MTKESGSGRRHQLRVGCRRTRHPAHTRSHVLLREYLFNTPSTTLFIIDMPSPVKLYVYDLSNGMVRAMSMKLVGRQIDGLW